MADLLEIRLDEHGESSSSADSTVADTPSGSLTSSSTSFADKTKRGGAAKAIKKKVAKVFGKDPNKKSKRTIIKEKEEVIRALYSQQLEGKQTLEASQQRTQELEQQVGSLTSQLDATSSRLKAAEEKCCQEREANAGFAASLQQAYQLHETHRHKIGELEQVQEQLQQELSKALLQLSEACKQREEQQAAVAVLSAQTAALQQQLEHAAAAAAGAAALQQALQAEQEKASSWAAATEQLQQQQQQQHSPAFDAAAHQGSCNGDSLGCAVVAVRLTEACCTVTATPGVADKLIASDSTEQEQQQHTTSRPPRTFFAKLCGCLKAA